MDARLQELLDHHEIRRTLAEYCHGLNRGDELRMASVYANVSQDVHGSHNGSGQEVARAVMQVMRDGPFTHDSHMLGQSLINVDGDTAGADTYFLASIIEAKDDGGEMLWQMAGRYVDAFIREDGHWKIRKRIVVGEWANTSPLENNWIKQMGFVLSRRSNEDPSFAALGLEHSELAGKV